MKKFLTILALASFVFAAYSCTKAASEDNDDPKPKEEKIVKLTVQLSYSGKDYKVAGIPVTLNNTNGLATYEQNTDANGAVAYEVPAGNYVAIAYDKATENGQFYSYSGAAAILAPESVASSSTDLVLSRSVAEQIIIKELYNGGCTKADGKGYSDDGYVVLYNNSEMEADASNIVITFSAPYNGQATGTAAKYFDANGICIYQHLNWQPAYGAIWWFKEPVKIPPYSQIVIAFFGAIDHTAIHENSVDLSKSEYYVMSNDGIAAYTNKKYQVADNIPASHYLTTIPISTGNAWALSNSAPAFYIGKVDNETVQALIADTENYDHTQGASGAFNVAKFPKKYIVDAVEVWKTADVAKSTYRFSPEINIGHVCLTNNIGHTLYRNVDKAATEALAENAGKLVYDYKGGTEAEDGGSTDPSGIDAEASIAAGAHIIYQETNNSGKDFHQRAKASIKK